MASLRSVSPPTSGAGFSMTSMTVVSTGICATCLLAAVSGGRFFSAAGLFALMPPRRALDFAFFGVARFAANLRAGLVLTLPRFELSLSETYEREHAREQQEFTQDSGCYGHDTLPRAAAHHEFPTRWLSPRAATPAHPSTLAQR
jgi:hypothetical protein